MTIIILIVYSVAVFAFYKWGYEEGRAGGIRAYHFADNAERKELLLELRGSG